MIGSGTIARVLIDIEIIRRIGTSHIDGITFLISFSGVFRRRNRLEDI